MARRIRRSEYDDPDVAFGIPPETPPAPVLVYFVQAGDDGPVKIGSTQDVAKRMRGLQTAHHQPLRLLFTLPGGVELERRLHAKFGRSRLKGEWFRPTPMLLAFIRENIRESGHG